MSLIGEGEDPSPHALWTEAGSSADYGANATWSSHLLEQYKLYVEMADRVSQRRATAGSYFLAVNAAILAFAGFATAKDATAGLWILALGGIAIALLWRAVIRSYQRLSAAKYLVVHAIEKRLPISPYDAEWELMRRGRDPRRYRPLSHIESGVPWVFLVLHVAVLFRSIASAS